MQLQRLHEGRPDERDREARRARGLVLRPAGPAGAGRRRGGRALAALLACVSVAGAGACRRSGSRGGAAGEGAVGAGGSPEAAVIAAALGGGDGAAGAPGADDAPCAEALQSDADGFVERRARERGADSEADLRARARYNQCQRFENDDELRRAPAKRRAEVSEVRAALAGWVGARAKLEAALGRGDARGRARVAVAALTDVERLVATTLLPGAWRAGGRAGDGAAAAEGSLRALASAGGEGVDGPAFREAYEGLKAAQGRVGRAAAPLAPPEAAAVWRFVGGVTF